MLFTGSDSKPSMEQLWPTRCASRVRVGCIQGAARSTGKALPGLFEGEPKWPRLPSGYKGRTILKAQRLFLLIIQPRDQTACGPISCIGKRALGFACARWVRIARRRTRISRLATKET